ncbi:sulfotransferase [Prosthecodimorpha staleyi]|uniref:Sulfotransferase n=1 Tax=Prosthecodimorpha staleyi TaxID=2840188 RepID=A0A947D297_9HYPH|nr:sulfotransferase [Prosthecodimorpha staleyi]MBT9288968.1 sulfotransferase [Prosthecodimorpha staleyi]
MASVRDWLRRLGMGHRHAPGLSAVSLARFRATRTLPVDRVNPGESPGRFDVDTLFFDIFRDTAPDRVVALGPRIDTVTPELGPIRFRAGGADLDAEASPARPGLPLMRWTISGRDLGRAGRIEVLARERRADVAIQPSGTHLFAGRRVLLTLSQDNPLAWIRDWAEYHVRTQGIDAVLLYDNASTRYAPQDIAAALSGIAGLIQVTVVSWPFPYGLSQNAGLDRFCQVGALEHARRRFLARSRGVLSLDIDELVVSGGPSVLDRLEGSKAAAMVFRGFWAEAPAIASVADRDRLRHRDCLLGLRGQVDTSDARVEAPCRPKWAAIPARLDDDAGLAVHAILGPDSRVDPDQVWSIGEDMVHFRHLRQINSGWKTERWKSEAYDAARHHFAVDLADRFDAVWGADTTRAARQLWQEPAGAPVHRIIGPFSPRFDFVLLCLQRSGSHMLGSALGRHPRVAFHGEFGPLRRRGAYVPVPGKLNFAAVMYNQTEEAAALGVDLSALPIIHLVRDLRAVAVSNLRSALSRRELGRAHRAHFRDPGAIPAQMKYMPPEDEIRDWMARHAGDFARLQPLIGANPRILTIDYAELTGSGDVREILPEPTERICRFLGVEPAPLPVSIVKSGGPVPPAA